MVQMKRAVEIGPFFHHTTVQTSTNYKTKCLCEVFALVNMCPFVCVSVSAWGCVRWWWFCRHGWREWAGLRGVRVGGAEEDQSYCFAGGRLQRYVHTDTHKHTLTALKQHYAGFSCRWVSPDPLCCFWPSFRSVCLSVCLLLCFFTHSSLLLLLSGVHSVTSMWLVLNVNREL